MPISDKDKLGMAALIASMSEAPKKKLPLPKPRPATPPMPARKKKKPTKEDLAKGRISIGDANDMSAYKSGGMVDGMASRGKTKGKMC